MDSDLRRAWTKIVEGGDYDDHMAAVGQAQAAAELARDMISEADLAPGSRLILVGAGTGQLFDYLDPAFFGQFRIVCTDLNPDFLARLRQRLTARNLNALIVADDLEYTALRTQPELLIVSLVLEHIDWRAGVKAIAAFHPAACGVVIQENPPGMTSAVTPGRAVPASIAAAVQIARPTLVPQEELLGAFESHGYRCKWTEARAVADGKRLIGMLFIRE